jgi:hypothetical protein
VLLGHGQDQFHRNVLAIEVAHVHFRNPFVVDGQAQTGAVAVGAVQAHGAGAHHPRTFLGLLGESGSRYQGTQNSGGDDLLFHMEQIKC